MDLKELRRRLRELLNFVADEDAPGEADVDADEADTIEDDTDAIEDVEESEDDEPEDEPDEKTPGSVDEADDAGDEDLRAVIREQAARIETLKNRLAEHGVDEDEIEALDAAEDLDEDAAEDDVVAAFDSDYAERQARLAEILED